MEKNISNCEHEDEKEPHHAKYSRFSSKVDEIAGRKLSKAESTTMKSGANTPNHRKENSNDNIAIRKNSSNPRISSEQDCENDKDERTKKSTFVNDSNHPNKQANEDPPINEEDEEDEYFAMIERRNRLMEKGGSVNVKVKDEEEDRQLSTVKPRQRLTENQKVRVYLFEQQDFIDIIVFFGEKMRDLKAKVIQGILNIPKFSKFRDFIKFKSPDAYELRIAEDEGDVSPNMDFPPFDDHLNIIESKNHTVCFIERQNFNPDENVSNVLGADYIPEKVVLKIYNRTDRKDTQSCIIEESAESTLRTVLERLEKKKVINRVRNFDYYFLCEHVPNPHPEGFTSMNGKPSNLEKACMEDIDNEINLDTQLKFLTTFELDVFAFI